MSFIFGEGTGVTREQLEQKRRIARMLGRGTTSAPRNVGEGLTAIGKALAYRKMSNEIARDEARLNPNYEGLRDVSRGRREIDPEVIEALLAGAPNYRRGTPYARGGMAVVGEDGPEVVNLPQGAQVFPSRDTFAGGDYPVAEVDAFKLMQLQPEYATPVEADLNSDEGKRIAYLRRAMFADAAMQDPDLAKAMTRMDNNIAGGLGALGRLYTGDDYELGRLMAEQFASAILRRDSGAATPDPEVARYTRQYFPLSNETDDQLAAKAALRREEIRALAQSLGGDAAPVVAQIQQEIADLIAAAQKDEAAPDISDDDKAFLATLGID